MMTDEQLLAAVRGLVFHPPPGADAREILAAARALLRPAKTHAYDAEKAADDFRWAAEQEGRTR